MVAPLGAATPFAAVNKGPGASRLGRNTSLGPIATADVLLLVARMAGAYAWQVNNAAWPTPCVVVALPEALALLISLLAARLVRAAFSARLVSSRHSRQEALHRLSPRRPKPVLLASRPGVLPLPAGAWRHGAAKSAQFPVPRLLVAAGDAEFEGAMRRLGLVPTNTA